MPRLLQTPRWASGRAMRAPSASPRRWTRQVGRPVLLPSPPRCCLPAGACWTSCLSRLACSHMHALVSSVPNQSSTRSHHQAPGGQGRDAGAGGAGARRAARRRHPPHLAARPGHAGRSQVRHARGVHVQQQRGRLQGARRRAREPCKGHQQPASSWCKSQPRRSSVLAHLPACLPCLVLQVHCEVTCSAAGPYGLTGTIESFMADSARKSLQVPRAGLAGAAAVVQRRWVACRLRLHRCKFDGVHPAVLADVARVGCCRRCRRSSWTSSLPTSSSSSSSSSSSNSSSSRCVAGRTTAAGQLGAAPRTLLCTRASISPGAASLHPPACISCYADCGGTRGSCAHRSGGRHACVGHPRAGRAVLRRARGAAAAALPCGTGGRGRRRRGAAV